MNQFLVLNILRGPPKNFNFVSTSHKNTQRVLNEKLQFCDVLSACQTCAQPQRGGSGKVLIFGSDFFPRFLGVYIVKNEESADNSGVIFEQALRGSLPFKTSLGLAFFFFNG